jgi:hypothetical protein
MIKVKCKSWMIHYTEPIDVEDDPYGVSYEYQGEDGSNHEVRKYFKTYQAAYGWLNESVEL